MGAEHDVAMPQTEDEFFALQWTKLTNEQVGLVLDWSKGQEWWRSVYSGFAARSTGRSREVVNYLNGRRRTSAQ